MTGAVNQPTVREALAEISRRLVSLHKQFYGKGPVKAKTFLIDDTVVCTLEGGFTVVERTLIEVGRESAVYEIRTSFQAAMREQFTTVVEEALDRQVRAYMSQVHTDPDIAVEIFMLEPVGKPIQAEYELERASEGQVKG
ncbi:MAG: Na-translocating system protein MpsC family protein [Gaiellaceae bacterium]